MERANAPLDSRGILVGMNGRGEAAAVVVGSVGLVAAVGAEAVAAAAFLNASIHAGRPALGAAPPSDAGAAAAAAACCCCCASVADDT